MSLATNNFFFDANVILDSPPHPFDKKNLRSAAPVPKINSTFRDAGSIVQTSSKSEEFNSSSENSVTPIIAAQKSALSPILIAPAITPTDTSRSILISDPSDIDPFFSTKTSASC